MRLLFFLTFLICSFHFNALARKRSTFYFDSSITYLVQPQPFSGIRVIDLRSDTTNILVTLKNGFTNTDVVTDGPFSKEATRFGQRYITRQPGADTLLAIIHGQEIVLRPDEGLVLLKEQISFYSGQHDAYHFLFSADSFYEAYMAQRDDRWEQLLTVAWHHYFLKASLDRALPEGQTYTTAEAIARQSDLKKRFAIYNTTAYPTGIYFTRASFLELKPDLVTFKEYDNPDGSTYPHYYHYITAEGKKGERIKEADYYAVYNGIRWYKSGKYGLYQLHYEHGDFYFEAAMNGVKGLRKSNNYYGGGLIGGLASAIVSNNYEEATIGKKGETNVRYKLRLDAETGQYIPVFRFGNANR